MKLGIKIAIPIVIIGLVIGGIILFSSKDEVEDIIEAISKDKKISEDKETEVVFGADTGFVLPTSANGCDPSCDNVWDNPNNILSDGTDARRNNTEGGALDYISGSSFSPGVPAGKVIDGIYIQISAGNGEGGCSGAQMKVHNGTSWSSGEAFSFSSGRTTTYEGGATNLWGLSWTVSGANSIKVALSDCTNDSIAALNYFKVKIYYSDPEVPVKKRMW